MSIWGNIPHPMRAEGNLSYLQFIKLVQELWKEGHPDIPIYPTQGNQMAKYPSIIYGLESREPVANEPKMRYREEIIDSDNRVNYVKAQRFRNIVSFTVVDEKPIRAELVIEAFEDFMHEITEALKRLGISDIFYARRLPDNEENRGGEDVARRAIAYIVITEKLITLSYDRLEKIEIDARVFLENYVVEDIEETDVAVTINIVDQNAANELFIQALGAWGILGINSQEGKTSN